MYGGASQSEQEDELAQPTSMATLVVGTPGRLLAVMGTGALGLERARLLVLDEADRMLALGFAEQLEQIREALPANERDDGSASPGRARRPRRARAEPADELPPQVSWQQPTQKNQLCRSKNLRNGRIPTRLMVSDLSAYCTGQYAT